VSLKFRACLSSDRFSVQSTPDRTGRFKVQKVLNTFFDQINSLPDFEDGATERDFDFPKSKIYVGLRKVQLPTTAVKKGVLSFSRYWGEG
jgi:hypothetical protein